MSTTTNMHISEKDPVSIHVTEFTHDTPFCSLSFAQDGTSFSLLVSPPERLPDLIADIMAAYTNRSYYGKESPAE